jgi:hypothetical protein
MQKIARRSFCGTALMAFPLLGLSFQDNEGTGASDRVLDSIADEFARITTDGAQHGFRAEHFRRYASNMRIFDAHMEGRGVNKETNRKLEEEDYPQLNPVRTAQSVVEFWKKHGLYFDQDDLAGSLSIDVKSYKSLKSAIKKNGGVRKLHAKIADSFERKAKEFEAAAYHGGPRIKAGRVTIPRSEVSGRPLFVPAQFDVSMFAGFSLDCLCRAMIIEGSLLSLLCVVGLLPCCEIAAFLLAFEKLMEGLGMCSPNGC